jgi:hypothetical protein
MRLRIVVAAREAANLYADEPLVSLKETRELDDSSEWAASSYAAVIVGTTLFVFLGSISTKSYRGAPCRGAK